MMKKSKVLQAEEAAKAERTEVISGKMTARSAYIQPNSDGIYSVQPIVCCGDFVAIAPLAPETVSKGGILLNAAKDERPSTGIVVGGNDVIITGTHVKFTPQHQVADLSGHYPFYGTTVVLAYRSASVVAMLPPLNCEIIVDSGPICNFK